MKQKRTKTYKKLTDEIGPKIRKTLRETLLIPDHSFLVKSDTNENGSVRDKFIQECGSGLDTSSIFKRLLDNNQNLMPLIQCANT